MELNGDEPLLASVSSATTPVFMVGVPAIACSGASGNGRIGRAGPGDGSQQDPQQEQTDGSRTSTLFVFFSSLMKYYDIMKKLENIQMGKMSENMGQQDNGTVKIVP